MAGPSSSSALECSIDIVVRFLHEGRFSSVGVQYSVVKSSMNRVACQVSASPLAGAPANVFTPGVEIVS